MRCERKAAGMGAALVVLSAFVPNLELVSKPDYLNFLKPVGKAFAQATKQATLSFSASVYNPLIINLAANASFGKFAVGGFGKIIVQTNGGTTASNQVIKTSGTNGVISVTAPNGIDFSLSLTKFGAGSNIYMATSAAGGAGASPSKTMTITQVKIAASTTNMNGKVGTYKTTNPAVTGYSVTVGSKGTMAVGSTIVIDGSEIVGTYRGSTVMVMSL